MTTHTVLLISHEPPLAMRWRQHLLAHGAFNVVGITNSQASARAMLQKHPVDVVVSDLSLMAATSNGAIHALRGGPSEDKPLVVMVADRCDQPLLLSALRGGADSYHCGALETLAETVAAAVRGESAIDPPIARPVLEQFDAYAPNTEDDPLGETPLQLLPHERQLLARVATGESVRQIADKDNVHPELLGPVVRGIYRKLRWILRANRLSLTLEERDSGFGDSVWGSLKPLGGRSR